MFPSGHLGRSKHMCIPIVRQETSILSLRYSSRLKASLNQNRPKLNKELVEKHETTSHSKSTCKKNMQSADVQSMFIHDFTTQTSGIGSAAASYPSVPRLGGGWLGAPDHPGLRRILPELREEVRGLVPRSKPGESSVPAAP